jgi:LysR family transcriptional regulator, transcription activator of glutamate synthase operon
MELRQLRYFIEVGKREHMTEAADALHVAQSAVSRQIVNLEQELGVDLFIREGRRVKLTPIGKIFLERMTHAMNVMDDGVREVTEYLNPERGTIRIAFPISLAAHTLPMVISAFRREYPEAKFQLKQGLYHDLISGVLQGDFNMAVIGPLPQVTPKLEQRVLFTENIVALLSVNHPLADLKTVRLRELMGDPFVLLPEGFVFREMVLEACRDVGFSPNVAFEGDDIDALKGLVAAGLGVTLMPEATLMDTQSRSTVKIPIAEPAVTRTVGIITSKDRALLPTEEIFYDFITSFFDRLSRFR